MRKEYIILLILASFFWSCTHSPKVPELRVGLVNFAVGKVFLSGPSGKEAAAKPGDPLGARMTVRTVGEASLCEIYFDNTVVKISGNSVCEADTILYGKGLSESTQLTLKKGESFINTPKLLKNSAFTIKTSTTVAAVRGTEFAVSASGDKTKVSCLSGKVIVSGINRDGTPEEIISADETCIRNGSSDAGKKTMTAEDKTALTAKRHTAPLTAENADTFEKIRGCDTVTIDRIKAQLESFYLIKNESGIKNPVPQTDSAAVTEKISAGRSDRSNTTAAQAGRNISETEAPASDTTAQQKTESSANERQRPGKPAPDRKVQQRKEPATPVKIATKKEAVSPTEVRQDRSAASQANVLSKKESVSAAKSAPQKQPAGNVATQQQKPVQSSQSQQNTSAASPTNVLREKESASAAKSAPQKQPAVQAETQRQKAPSAKTQEMPESFPAEKVLQKEKSAQPGSDKQQKKGAPGGQTVPPYENTPYYVE